MWAFVLTDFSYKLCCIFLLMIRLSIVLLTPMLSQLQHFFSNIPPGYLDIIKIFAGSIGWVGGLTLFMWMREKRKHVAAMHN